jgi:hypothetical protein
MKNMKISITIFILCTFLLLILGCQSESVRNTSNICSQISNTKHKNIEDFKKIKKDDDIKAIYQKVGMPNRDCGSGVYIMEYDIEEGGKVTIHTHREGTTKINYTKGEIQIEILK